MVPCECTSRITGTLWRPILVWVRCAAGVFVAGFSAGSGASGCTLGTRSMGNETPGTERVGSGVVGPGTAGWRRIVAIGLA